MEFPPAPLEVLEGARRAGDDESEAVRGFVRSWLIGGATDAQMAGWLTRVHLAPPPPSVLRALVSELIASGDRLELAALGATGTIAATGAVGEDVLLVAAPLAAVLGVRVAVVGGRSVGVRLGTVDALEAVPGLRTALSLREVAGQVRDAGCALVAPTDRLLPGEARLAELRHQIACGGDASLAAASAVAGALALGTGAIALQVTAGAAGGDPGDAAGDGAATARLMADLAAPWGRTLRAVVARSSAPVGRVVGAALGVSAAGEVLRGGGDAGVRTLAARLAGVLAEAAGVVPAGEGHGRAGRALSEGRALEAAERWVAAQGGDPAVWTDASVLPAAPLREEVTATAGGTVAGVDAVRLGAAVRRLGAGRLHPAQTVDPAVGVTLEVAPGDPVAPGDLLARVHARDAFMARACADEVRAAVLLGASADPAAGLHVREVPLA